MQDTKSTFVILLYQASTKENARRSRVPTVDVCGKFYFSTTGWSTPLVMSCDLSTEIRLLKGDLLSKNF